MRLPAITGIAFPRRQLSRAPAPGTSSSACQVARRNSPAPAPTECVRFRPMGPGALLSGHPAGPAGVPRGTRRGIGLPVAPLLLHTATRRWARRWELADMWVLLDLDWRRLPSVVQVSSLRLEHAGVRGCSNAWSCRLSGHRGKITGTTLCRLRPETPPDVRRF